MTDFYKTYPAGAAFRTDYAEAELRVIAASLSEVGPGITLTSDKAAAVNRTVPWLSVTKYPPPLNTKVLLINRNAGSATLGSYAEGSWWTHWAGLPYHSDEDDS